MANENWDPMRDVLNLREALDRSSRRAWPEAAARWRGRWGRFRSTCWSRIMSS